MSKNFTFLLIVVVCVALLFVYFKNFFMQPVYIDEPSQQQEFFLQQPESDKHPNSIRIEVSGELNGEAVLLVQPKVVDKYFQGYEFKLPKGDVRLNISRDWYTRECRLIYKPVTVTDGHLTIKHRFSTLF